LKRPNQRAELSPEPLISVLIPIYNEEGTLREILARVRATGLRLEIVCVDDGSTDGSRAILAEEAKVPGTFVHLHEKNLGKGGAIQTALRHATGEVMVIQDADLEYDPADFHLLIRPIQQGRTKAVYGSRFKGETRTMYFWHSVGNHFLTLVTNVLYDTTLSDMETCYKMFTADIAKELTITSNGWGIDPEITAKILKMGYRIYEVPISYAGREFWEGKKISWVDGLTVLWTLVKLRVAG
jgi:glycosyltransferase involved in cell wall biosynthesis